MDSLPSISSYCKGIIRRMKLTSPPERATYTLAEAAWLLGVSVATLRRAIAAGEVPGLRVRGRILVPRESFDRLLSGGNTREAIP